MTVLEHSPRTIWAPRQHRRREIVTTGGMDGVLRIGTALATCGYAIRDFAVDVREGIAYSSVTCTVSLTSAESHEFADRLGSLPDVVSVDPC